MSRALALAAAALVVAACGEPPRPARPAPSPPRAATVTAPAFETGRWGEYRSRRFDLVVPLPDGRAWRIDDHASGWLVATHPPTSSVLLVRTWTEDAIVNRERCEARARLWRDLPRRDSIELVEERAIPVPPDFDTHVEIGVQGATGEDGAIEGVAMAFGGWAHRCFAYVLTTAAHGHGAERVVGERLAVMVEGSLAKIETRSELEPDVRREPFEGAPP